SSPNRSMMNWPTSVVDVGSVCVAHARNSSIWSGDSRPVPPFRSNRTSASTPPSWNSLSQMRMVESSMNSASATAAKDQPRLSSRTAFARRETRFSSSPSLAIATRSTRSAALRKLRFVFTRRLESIPVIRSNDFRKGEESRYPTHSSSNRAADPVQRADRPRLSPGDYGNRANLDAKLRQWQPCRKGWRGRRLGFDRAELQERPLFPSAPLGDDRHRSQRFDEDDLRAVQRRQFVRLEPRPDVAEA